MQSKDLLCKPNLREICTHSALLCLCDKKEDPYIKEVKRKETKPTKPLDFDNCMAKQNPKYELPY